MRCMLWLSGAGLVIQAALLAAPGGGMAERLARVDAPRIAKIVRETLHTMAGNGVSIFMSTHSLPTAEELCDRVGFIKDGRLVFVGTQEHLQAYKKKYDGKFESVFLELTK